MKKFNIVDYIIIILVICAVIFAFIHITTDDSSDLQKTAFDESTINKIPDTYLKYYEEGRIVNADVEGINSTNGENVEINGEVIWLGDNGGSDVTLLIQSQNNTYTVGTYRYNPQVNIYIDHISLESNGETYKNLTEITVKPKEINRLNDLISGIGNDTDYEITTKIALDDIDSTKIQEMENKLSQSGRDSIQSKSNEMSAQFVISKATKENINDADSILGNIDGTSDEITIRIYDSTSQQVNAIKNSYDVINIRTF